MSVIKKLQAIQSELEVPKNQYNAFGKYNYRSGEDILAAAKPLCIKHGCLLTVTDEIVQLGDRFYVKATARLLVDDTSDPYHLETTAYAREELSKKGMDGSQITGSASSYARKYALNGLFCLDDVKDADSINKHETEKSKTGKGNGNKQVDEAQKVFDPEITEDDVPQGTNKCEDCGVEIDQRVLEYSKDKFGRALCRKCQNKARKEGAA